MKRHAGGCLPTHNNKTVMVGNIGALQSQEVLSWTPIEAVLLVNKPRKWKFPILGGTLLLSGQKCHRCIRSCVMSKFSTHMQISCKDIGGKYIPSFLSGKVFYRSKKRNAVENVQTQNLRRSHLVPRAHVDLASGLEVINDLGLDTLTFLAVTVLVIPIFKSIKASPILGFFLSGVVLNHLGLIRNITDVKALSELGILFLLFEMGLELSLARLRALAKFAFGMGLAQVLLSTLAFTAFELPPNGAIGTKILEFLFHSRPDLVNIRTIDEAVVIGAALSMSSSAFVLQLLSEKGELPTRFGSATLGILLFQDIAVVPLLVILPILESGNLEKESVWPVLAAESLKALGGLGALSLGGQIFIRRLFEIVADSRSAEAFNALCLLTVTGTSLITQKLGFSDTLGAFLAGALLAETNFRTQIEAEIRPFKGLLLGLFFVTTGTSIDIQLLFREWPNVLTLLGGLIAIKTAIITAVGPRVGLSLSESMRIGLLLSQGGEFAFVVFSLANRLGVLPSDLNRLLIIVVVLSMSLTPFLNELGQKAAELIEAHFDTPQENIMEENFEVNEPVVIVGFGQMGQVLANFLSAPLASGAGGDSAGWRFVAFDLDPGRVKAARKVGFPVLYGDGSRPAVLQTAGISMPKAVMVMYTARQKAVQAVERLRLAFPGIPIYARAQDIGHLLELKAVGATDAILENTETSLQLGSVLLRGLGVLSDDVTFLTRIMRESMELRARVALEKKEEKDEDWLTPFQAKVKKTWNTQIQKVTDVPKGSSSEVTDNNAQQAIPEAEVRANEVHEKILVESGQAKALSTGSLLEHMSESGTRKTPAQSEAGMKVQSSLKHESPNAEESMQDRIQERETKNVAEPLTISTIANGENFLLSSTDKAKLAWHQRMKISNHHIRSNTELEAVDGDVRGVTWCALPSKESVKDFEKDMEDTISGNAECTSNYD